MKNSLKDTPSFEDALPKLTSAEKESMKTELILFMNAHPIQSPSADSRWRTVLYGMKNFHFNSWAAPAYAIALFTIVILGFGYTSGKDPGSISFSPQEPAYVTHVSSPDIKTKHDSILLAEKLEQVESYLSDPSVPSANISEIENDIDTHTDALQGHIHEAEQSGDTMKALQMSSQLEITLDTHEKLIESLYQETSLLDEKTLHELLANIEEERLETKEIRNILMEKIDLLEDEQAGMLTAQIQKQLDTVLTSIDEDLGADKDQMPAEARIFMLGAWEMRERGVAHLEEDKHTHALREFLLGLHAAKKAQHDVEAHSEQTDGENE